MIALIVTLIILGFIVYKVIEDSSKIPTTSSRTNKSISPFIEDAIQREKFLKISIEELETQIKEGKIPEDDSIKLLLNKYKEELYTLHNSLSKQRTYSSYVHNNTPQYRRSEPARVSFSLEHIVKNWYEDNSINLLLYIGAFLIVSAAAIYVAVSWNSVAGTFKVILLAVFTILFFLIGDFFLFSKKYKNAGVTFLGIGALLLPINGIAVQTFILNPNGYNNISVVWILISLLCLIVYSIMAFLLRSNFYAYILSISSLSLIESLVYLGNLSAEYYIMGGVANCIILLLSTYSLKKNRDIVYLSYPLKISSLFIMPFVLAYGLCFVIINNSFFTLQTAITFFSTAFFYGVLYITDNNENYLITFNTVLALGFFVIAYILGGNDPISIAYASNFLAFIYIILVERVIQKHLINPKQTKDIFNTTIVVLSFFSIFLGLFLLNALTIFISVLALAILYLTSSEEIYLISIISSFILGVTILCSNLGLDLSTEYNYLSLIYVPCAVIFYVMGMILWKEHKEKSKIFIVSSIFLFSLALLICLGYFGLSLFVAISIFIISFLSLYFFLSKKEVYAMCFSLFYILGLTLNLIGIDIEWYPLFFFGLILILYIFHDLKLPSFIKEGLRESILVSALVVPFTFIILEPANSSGNSNLEFYSILTSFCSFIIYAVEGIRNKSMGLKYMASAIGMFSLLWYLSYLNITEIQAYAIPLGVYFIVLAYAQERKKGDVQAFNTTGLLILTFSLICEYYSNTNNWVYSLLLGIEGALFIGMGISLKDRLFLYWGVGSLVIAILIQFSQFILTVPQWVIVGIGGFIFLAIAIYLLHKRENISFRKMSISSTKS